MLNKIKNISLQLDSTPTCDGRRMRSQVLDLQGRTEEAEKELRACEDCKSPLPCARERVWLSQKQGHAGRRRAAEASFLGLGCNSDELCAASETWVGNLATIRGDWPSAYAHYIRAASRVPSYDSWNSAAQAAARSGQLASAQLAYHQAKILGERYPKTEQLLRQARNRILEPSAR